MTKLFTWIVVICGFVVLMSTTMLSGKDYCFENRCGDYYWGAHEHDGIWHMALAETAFESWPPTMPSYSGAQLIGYNWLMDYPLALLAKAGIGVKFSYFSLLPIVWFISMLATFKRFASRYQPNDWFYPILLFFLFFGNSLSFLLNYWHRGSLLGGSSILAMQPPAMLTNIQYALTLPLIAVAMSILLGKIYKPKDNWSLGLIVFFTFGLKFYGGAILATLIIANSILTKKYLRIVVTLVGVALAAVIFYKPTSVTEPIFSLRPLATVYPIIEEKSLAYSQFLAQARYTYQNSPLIILVGAVAVGVFLVLNFGARLIGLWKLQHMNVFEKSVFIAMTTAILANILLVQRGEWWNTVQFLYYGMLLMSIFAASVLANLLSNTPRLGKWILAITIFLSIPNLIDTIKIFWAMPPGSYISRGEIQILNQLKMLPAGTVLALPVEVESHASSNQALPLPLHQRYESAYVAAYSGKTTYLNDLVQSRLVGIDYQKRLNDVRLGNCEILTEVSYIYVAGKSDVEHWLACGRNISLLVSNNDAKLFRLD